MTPTKLTTLMVFKKVLDYGHRKEYWIILSGEHTDSSAIPHYLKRGKDEYLWKVAISRSGMGCKIVDHYEEDVISHADYMGMIQNLDMEVLNEIDPDFSSGRIGPDSGLPGSGTVVSANCNAQSYGASSS